MRLWRLSSVRHAPDFDGGYGLFNNGRWNTKGRPITYCATVPSLAVLEKRVHVRDFELLPPQALVEYDVPDDLPSQTIAVEHLPTDWAARETLSQSIGNEWLDSIDETILVVPSVIMPIRNVIDRNVLINHRHVGAGRIMISSATPLTLDPRLFQP